MVPPMMRNQGARWGQLVLVGSLLTAACGDDEGNGAAAVTADEVRTFYGLWPGTCLVYGFDDQAQTAVMAIEASPPTFFQDRDEVIWDLSSGNFQPHRRYLEARDGGEVRLLLEQSRPNGQLVTRTYAGPGGVEPLFADLRRGAGDTLDFAGSSFRTGNAKPSETINPDSSVDDDPPVEVHEWIVGNRGVSVGTEPPLDDTIQMTYSVERENVSDFSTWNFVPNLGFVQIQDFSVEFGGTGEVFVLSDYQICNQDGSCEGERPERCPPL